MKEGDTIILNESENFLKAEFNKIWYVWGDGIRPMLGQPFPLISKLSSINDNNILALPSPDGSAGGRWYFSCAMVTKISKCTFVLVYLYH